MPGISKGAQDFVEQVAQTDVIGLEHFANLISEECRYPNF